MDENYEPEHRAEDAEPVVGDAPPRAHVLFSNKVYDVLKFVALVLLPALGTLYFTVAATTGLPYGQEVVGVIVAVDTFLGLVLGLSTNQYRNSEDRLDGQIDVTPDHENQVTNLNVSLDPAAVAGKDEVVLKVNRV
jgi:hypothetical protein